MTVALGVGARLPAYPTSMGRVLLSALSDEDLTAYLETLQAEPLTDRTVTAPDALRAGITRARADGYALVDQELELGLRSIAAPIHNSRDRIIAALNVSAHASRSTPTSLCEDVLPHLQHAATQITTAITHRGNF